MAAGGSRLDCERNNRKRIPLAAFDYFYLQLSRACLMNLGWYSWVLYSNYVMNLAHLLTLMGELGDRLHEVTLTGRAWTVQDFFMSSSVFFFFFWVRKLKKVNF